MSPSSLIGIAVVMRQSVGSKRAAIIAASPGNDEATGRDATGFFCRGASATAPLYREEPILDHIKQQAMQVPFLRELLRSDSIYIRNNITVDNLQPVSSFLGKLGNPEKGGLGLREIKHHQELHRQGGK